METMISRILVSVWLFNGALGLGTNNVTVDGLGNVIGSIESTSLTNRTIYCFRGIPYGQPPIGDLRFRPPVKVTEWNGTLYATGFGNICPQIASNEMQTTSYDEDCLTLNVYVPEVETNATALPVMIFIHGGTFMAGSAAIYNPFYLLEKDVILVVPQFRLGVLGLLSLQTDEVPGNVQFLDQIMAMQWVQDNIGYFGGDKDSVTLFGQSSGAATVHLHLFSELSKGLFHRTILHSGSAFAPWVMDYNPVTTATNIATLLQCNTTNATEIASCMKTLSVETILNGFEQYLASLSLEGLSAMGGHRAVVQTAGEYKFLTEDPRTLAANAKFTQLPMMGGVTEQDGAFMLAITYSSLLYPYGLWNNTEYMENNFTAFSIKNLGIPDTTGAIRDSMINIYFNNDELGDFTKMVPGLIDICSLFGFKASVYDTLHQNSLVGQNTYLYTFNYIGTNSVLLDVVFPFDSGVNHGDDLIYLFPLYDNLSENDIGIVERMVQLWTSFATDGLPTADDVETWPAMSTRAGPYLIIDTEATTGDNYLDEYTATIRNSSTASSASLLISKPISIILVTMFMLMLRYRI